MRYAIVSDIHANWQAWKAVLEDIRARKVDALFCLGDVVGYGPRPAEVLADVRRCCEHVIMGNHEAAACGLMDADLFEDAARESLLWTRKKLGGDEVRWCRHLPYEILSEDMFCVHAETPAPKEFGYVERVEDAAACFDCNSADFIFLGHTHVPGVFLLSPEGTIARAEGSSFRVDQGARMIVNVGSVGMPRDGTAQATYCLFEPERRFVNFCKVSFDCEALRKDVEEHGDGWVPYFLREGGPAGERRAMKVTTVAKRTIRKIRKSGKSEQSENVGKSGKSASSRKTVALPPRSKPPEKGPAKKSPPTSSAPPPKGILIASAVGGVILLVLGLMLTGGNGCGQRQPASVGPAPAAQASGSRQPVRKVSRADCAPGIVGTYFRDARWTRKAAARVDSQVVFDWGSFDPVKGVRADAFSAIWKGYIRSAAAGDYTFSIVADDSAEVLIDGESILEGSKESAMVELEANTFHALEVKYSQRSGPARVKLYWKGPGFSRQIVPANRLWHTKE